MYLLIVVIGTKAMTAAVHAQEAEERITFPINAFVVEGSTVLPESGIRDALRGFTGPGKSAEDVEKARDTLESLYHAIGYPTVLVNIPEQTVEEGIVRLEVIESKIRRVRVTGNRYFTMEKILEELPSFSPGEILYIPRVKDELEAINRNPDLKIAPVLIPGKDARTIDVEIRVKDRLPLHGSLELNNRSTHDTNDSRLNAMMRYDNLWQREHSVSLQYQSAPEDTDEVQAVAGSYMLPAPWKDDHLLLVYGIWSDSDTAFGEGFEVIGTGYIVGTRYVIPLPPHGPYAHNLTVGLDYKDFDETTGFQIGERFDTPIRYLPLSFSYSSSLPDSWGFTQFSGSANMAFRGWITDPDEFEDKRFKARGNYLYATAGVERMQRLPLGLGLFLKLDGQIADQPLISNEQYSAGGMESVRGYHESEELGDDALHGTAELSSPDLANFLGLADKVDVTAYAFYDGAVLKVIDPLPGQEEHPTLQGTGGGFRGSLLRHFEYDLAGAIALSDTTRTEKGDMRIHFRVKLQF